MMSEFFALTRLEVPDQFSPKETLGQLLEATSTGKSLYGQMKGKHS